jgi:hypothetical protein
MKAIRTSFACIISSSKPPSLPSARPQPVLELPGCPFRGWCVSTNHPLKAGFSVPALAESNGIHKTRRFAKNVLASELTQGRQGAYFRREYAGSFWSTATRRPVRDGLALHRRYTGNPASIYGRGKGVYLCELNLLNGKLTVLRLVTRFCRRREHPIPNESIYD